MLEPDRDIKDIVEENTNKPTTIECFYDIFEPKWKRTIKKCIPIWLHQKYNKWAYDHDEFLSNLSNRWDAFDDKYLMWYRKLKWWHTDNTSRMFSHRIPQALAWAKLGWNDYDWDYHYFLLAIKFKLEKMEKCIRKYDRHVGTQNYCDQMKLCLECLNRFLDDNYIDNIYKELENKYPEYEKNRFSQLIDSKNDRKKIWLDEHGKKHVVYETIKSYNSRNEPEGYRQDWERLNHYYDKLKTADLRVFFHIMTPGVVSYSQWKAIKQYNRGIYEKYGYDGEAEEHVKTIHSGLFSWWD